MLCFAVNYEEKLIVCDSIHINIDYFICLLEHFICIFFVGNTILKTINKITTHPTYQSLYI